MLITDVLNNAVICEDGAQDRISFIELLYSDASVKVTFYAAIASPWHIDDYGITNDPLENVLSGFNRVNQLAVWFYDLVVR